MALHLEDRQAVQTGAVGAGIVLAFVGLMTLLVWVAEGVAPMVSR